MPVPGGTPISSPYGMRVSPISGTYKLHDGIDFAAGCGSPQYAPRAGVVASALTPGQSGGGGYTLYINHGLINGSSYVSRNYHMQSMPIVSPGQQVAAGQVVGYTGTTGNSTGCHLHFSMLVNGSTVNPANYLW